MLALLLTAVSFQSPEVAKLQANDVVWDSPSKDAAGSMPIGNGEVVLNAWVESASGDLLFYIGRSDSLSEISRILKLGRVRVHFNPAPFKSATDFQQHLHLHDGNISFEGGGAHLNLFVDSGSHVIHIDGATAAPSHITATMECWRNADRVLPKAEQASAWSVHDAPFPLVESADQTVDTDENGVTWFHRNSTSVVPALWKNQDLTGLPGTFDPLINRTFGGRLSGAGFRKASGWSIETAEPQTRFSLSIATCSAQTSSVKAWVDQVKHVEAQSPLEKARSRTEAWWHAFWDRSYVFVGGPGAESITRGYVLQRFMQACQGRGLYPIKFNGGTATVEPTAVGRPFNADWRSWGDSQWWQNVRHMYHPMFASGDVEMTDALFKLYEACRPLAESRTKQYHGVSGAYFPETMTDYGTYSGGDYGWNRTGHSPKDVLCPWWQYAWNQGLELSALMLDRWDYTRDSGFLKHEALPMADSVLTYFDTRFTKDASGRIVLDPTQSIETYWTGVINDMPSTAGLIAVTERLCALPETLTTPTQRSFFKHMRDACPELPTEVRDGEKMLAPAQKYNPNRTNSENPELYAVWPFRLITVGKPEMRDIALAAYAHRHEHLDVGWGYDGNVAALLGMADEAARIMKVKCANSNKAYRWPATWGPNYDWLPDQNHGGNLLNTADLMLIQGDPLEAGGKIYILPAWPQTWDVSFKLHAPGNTVVECSARYGKIERLTVSPKSREKDVVIAAGWTR